MSRVSPWNSSDQKAVESEGVSVGMPAELAGVASALLEGASAELVGGSATELLEGFAAELDSGTVLSVPAGLSEEQAQKPALATMAKKADVTHFLNIL